MDDLFIGGGGYSGIMFIGVLEYLHENDLLDLKNFYLDLTCNKFLLFVKINLENFLNIVNFIKD
jgi:hypothetical protein